MREQAGPCRIHLLDIFIQLLWQLLFFGALGAAADFEVSEWISARTICSIREKYCQSSAEQKWQTHVKFYWTEVCDKTQICEVK